MTFMEIWNNAYDILCDKDRHKAWEYLESQIDQKNIDRTDARVLYSDILETYNL